VVRRSAPRSASMAVAYCALPDPSGLFDRLRESAAQRSTAKPSFDDLSDDIASSDDLSFDAPGGGELPHPSSPAAFIANLNRGLARFLQVQKLPSSTQELETYGLPEDLASSLRQREGASGDEGSIVIAFLHALSKSVLSSHFNRGLLRLVLTAWKRHCADPALDLWLAESLAAADTSAWNWANLPMTEAASAPSP
jgi:hypothetical protein